MTNEEAQAFADEWIAAWNSHDLDRVLSHYAPEIVFLSPIAQKLVGNGRVVGISALRSYWEKALANLPQLKFQLLKVLVGHACLTVLYVNHRNQQAAETFAQTMGRLFVRLRAIRNRACGEISLERLRARRNARLMARTRDAEEILSFKVCSLSITGLTANARLTSGFDPLRT